MQTALKPHRRTLTKQELCIMFGLVSPLGRCYYGRLRLENFTDSVLDAIGMTSDRYKAVSRGRRFTYEETQRIIEHFEFTDKELLEL